MQQRKELNFNGQNIYVGIDVHLKTWSVTILTDSGYKKQYSQKSSGQELFEHLNKHYPGGNYLAAYESGFTGFSTYYALESYGIKCVVAHAADITSTQYENVMKTDKVDSAKLARDLKDHRLKSIYIHTKDNLDDRSLVRLRKSFQILMSGCKSRIKHFLYTNGVEYPPHFSKNSTHWSKRFLRWLLEEVKLLSQSRDTLLSLLSQLAGLRSNVLEVTRKIRILSQTGRYKQSCENLLSIPGIGLYTAMCLLTEIESVSRFANEKQFAHYLGLIPICHNSGDKESTGEKTFRGNKLLGTLIVESSWVTIRHDRALAAAYGNCCTRMKPQKAIIRIARKLSNRIFRVMKTGEKYEYDKC